MRTVVWFGIAACSSDYGIGGPSAPAEPPAPEESPPEPEADPPPPGTHEPIADAGPDQIVDPLDQVKLDATASYDPEGLEIVAVEWRLVAAPPGSTSVLGVPNLPRTEFFVDLAGQYVFELTVKNTQGVWDSTPDTVVIEAVPSDGFYVQLSWDAATDLDLHLLNGTTPPFESGDCNYCNMNPHWGDPGGSDDPSLDIDAIDGFGPETITIDAPADGVYTAAVHFYGERGDADCRQGCDPSMATVVVYLGGAPVATYQRLLDADDQVWTVAEIRWPEQEVEPIDEVLVVDDPSCTVIVVN
ncbi:MAG: hypothetical protein ABMA64_12435 [Myxococcota bacterium]